MPGQHNLAVAASSKAQIAFATTLAATTHGRLLRFPQRASYWAGFPAAQRPTAPPPCRRTVAPLHRCTVPPLLLCRYHRLVREGLEARLPAGEAVPPFLTRSAFAGSQRYGAVLWSGDIMSSFDELAVQVQVAQHVAMSGIYLWTTDIGGFRDGNTEDPVFRQLIVRWFMFGAFCPIFRLHGDRQGPQDKDVCGSTGHNEVWSFGDEA